MVCEGMLATACPLPQFRPTLAENELHLSKGQDLYFSCHMRVQFPTHNLEEHIQVDAMVDSGNRVPGSAVISEAGPVDPHQHYIMTANKEGQPLQVISKLRHLYMAVSHTCVGNLSPCTP